MDKTILKRTPLYSNHLDLNAKMVPFAGYEMPVQYPIGLLEETKACRKEIGLFDVSHMGQFSIRGKDALAETQKLVTNDLSKIQIGQAQYNMLCNNSGGVIDDLVIYRRAEDHIYICVNASNRETDWAWMTTHLSPNVTIEDESDRTALIAVQGPKAEELLKTLAPGEPISDIKYYWAKEAQIAGTSVYVSRTGYTGEDGFELYTPANKASELWNTLISHGKRFNITPCGLGARDTLRIEMGYPLHGHEISSEITPLQAALSWVVKLQKSVPFIGQPALATEASTGPARILRAFRINDRRIARQGYTILDQEGNRVGVITSGTHSPHLECPIALGFVERNSSEKENLWVEIRGSKVPMTRVKLPFVAPHTKKV